MSKVRYNVVTCLGDVRGHVDIETHENDWDEYAAARQAAVNANWNLSAKCGTCFDNRLRVQKAQENAI